MADADREALQLVLRQLRQEVEELIEGLDGN